MAYRDEVNGESGMEQRIAELQRERDYLKKSTCPNAVKVLSDEIDRLQGKYPGKNIPKYVDLLEDPPTPVTVKVIIPSKKYPSFNFVGKLLGPKGNSLKRLQEETMTRMTVKGEGSMRDKNKEDELRAKGDPNFGHLNEDLHVKIVAMAPVAEAYARIAHSLAEVRKFLIPVYNDDIAQEQRMEMEMMAGRSSNVNAVGRGAAANIRGFREGGRARLATAPSSLTRPTLLPNLSVGRAISPPPASRALSILSKARQSMEDSSSSYDAYSGHDNYNGGGGYDKCGSYSDTWPSNRRYRF